MFKNLRYKFLLMNMVSTFCIILISFAVIFSITYSNVQKDINRSIGRAMFMHRPTMWGRPQEAKTREMKPERQFEDMRSFSVFVDSSGNIKTDSAFGEDNSLYHTVAEKAAEQNAKKGDFVCENAYWTFETVARPDGTKLIALVDTSAEREIIKNLLISFVVCAAFILVAIFFLSLFFANRAIRHVNEAWQKQKQFVADASHELKTPLSAINTNIDVLLTHKDNKIADEEKWLQYIKSEAHRLTELADSLLFMAKMDGGVKYDLLPVNISEIVESTALNMEAVAFEKGLVINQKVEENIVINADAAQMTRLCVILIDNAVKYSCRGGAVDISFTKAANEHPVLKIHNGGEIIPKEEQAKIFDRFYRTDKSRTGTGYGLGLAIAKEITLLHGAKISVESREGFGTEFTVTF